METMRSLRQSAIELTLTSFVVLFQELTLIRWMSAEVRVLAYFPNVVLISAFLGLGIGSMRAGKRSLLWLWPISLVTLVAATLLMNRIAFTSQSATEHLWLLYYDIPNAPVVNDVRPPIIAAFVLTAISFLSLGQIPWSGYCVPLPVSTIWVKSPFCGVPPDIQSLMLRPE